MGLSASQARLLSVTQRISNNELKSQILANSKIRLADQNVAASHKYIQALDATKMSYVSYDETGTTKSIALTFNALTNYSPLKNQYALYNSQGQFYVSQTDANNFENSKNLREFLLHYNLIDDKYIDVENPQWVIDNSQYNADMLVWKNEEPQIEDFTKEVLGPPKWVHTNSDVYDAISYIGCFGIVKDTNARCYMHVLASILGFGSFTTSDGNTFEIENVSDVGWNWNSCTTVEAQIMDGLREQLKDDKVSDWAYEGELNTEAHGVVPVKGDGSDAAKYNVPGGGNAWQKCIDLTWELHSSYSLGSSTGGTATQEELEKFWYFVEVDIGDGHLEDSYITVPDSEAYDNAYTEWLNSEPIYPSTPELIKQFVAGDLLDRPKAQWYINLWYLMDGNKQSEVLSVSSNEQTNLNTYVYENVSKTVAAGENYYTVIDDDTAKSSTWLQFMLTNGLVTMEQAGLRSTGMITWEGTEWSSTTDIREVEDSSNVAKAEVEYQQTLKQIQAEDKKLDNDIKKLDTEHSSLKSEYDSIKNVLDKNVERSFTAFS